MYQQQQSYYAPPPQQQQPMMVQPAVQYVQQLPPVNHLKHLFESLISNSF
jgi:hypothetical protein